MQRGKRAPPKATKEESSSSSSGEEVELDLDESGRVRVDNLTVQPFRSFPNVLTDADAARLVPDAEAAFTVRATKKGSKYSAGNTFWLAADAKPESTLEMLAREIFNFHSKGATFDPARSGAEWWTQVLEHDDSIGLHWDKDYPLEEHGLNLCPQIGTVTYLSHLGGPTVVLEKTIPPLCSDEVAGKISRAFLSRPQVGKHMSFDGYFLHGAPAELAAFFAPHTAASATKLRITFLVNVWLNHKPTNSVALPAALRKKLSKEPLKVSISTESTATPFTSFASASESKPFEWTFAASEDAPFSLRLPQPKGDSVKADALELRFAADNTAELVVAAKEGKKKARKK